MSTAPGDARDDDAAPRGSSGRVAIAQRQARVTLGLAGAFAVVATVALAVPHRSGDWLPLHLFLTGTLLLAISAATQLFAVTWAAGPPPSARVAGIQRWLLVVGVVLLATARELRWSEALVAAGGASVIAALVVLGVTLERTVSRGVQRRFDVALRSYLAALSAGLGGCALGIVMALDLDPAVHARVRSAHLALNLLGLVGLVIAGTLPFFTATQARVKVSTRASRRAQGVVLLLLIGALGATTVGFLSDLPAVAALGLSAYAAAILGVGALLPAVRTKQLRWAGPRLVQLGAGIVWWFGAVVAIAWEVGRGEDAFTPTVVAVLVVGGYAQILLAAIAYLGPVLRAGGHQRLSAGFRMTRSWLGLAAANVAATALVLGARDVARVAIVFWLIDAVVRSVPLWRSAGHVGITDPSTGR